MPQHLWITTPAFRRCEVCEARQTARGREWRPEISLICPGDDDGRRRPMRRIDRPLAGGETPQREFV
jgi:hypothetical protein